MIDQELMVRLLRASNSKLPYLLPVQRIVILGDSQQLPSVGNGAVLMELTEDSGQSGADSYENPVPVVKLVKNYRQKISDTAGRNILGVAAVVNEMEIAPFPEKLFEAKSSDSEAILSLESLEDAALENVMFLNQENNINQLKDFGQWWYDKFLKDEKFLQLVQKGYSFEVPESIENDLDYLFNYLKQFRILTATQVFSTGAKALNKIIRDLWLMENEANLLNSEHFPGEPVIVTENNYRLRLFNGDQGIFLNCLNSETKKLELKAVFEVEGKVKTFYGHQLHHLQPAYATTVHKSQGSEFDHLALILPELSIDPIIGKPEPGRMRNIMSREMLYTALTRAKNSVLILGEKIVLETAALNKEKRYSGLGSLIRSKMS
jgi:exodeoxyribonuclease V alpha subunit